MAQAEGLSDAHQCFTLPTFVPFQVYASDSFLGPAEGSVLYLAHLSDFTFILLTSQPYCQPYYQVAIRRTLTSPALEPSCNGVRPSCRALSGSNVNQLFCSRSSMRDADLYTEVC